MKLAQRSMKLAQRSHSVQAPAVLVALAVLVPGVALGAEGGAQKRLIEKGRQLFMNETFGGNGRTCATCHPPTNNFTIDPPFIATLPDDDPLFVAEFDPDLAELEDPELMRRFGLVLENVDGFDEPGVFRGVPHTLGLRTTIKVDPAGSGNLTRADGSTVVEAMGWSGDGAPHDGSLRSFAIGAVTQHFPKTLNRVPGKDFRLPTEAELDALEAFQLSLGRQKELNLAPMTFDDADVQAGKDLFNGVGINRACSACHDNAGANNGDGFNANFSTNVALLTKTPARRFDPRLPGDGGFDAGPMFEVPGMSTRFLGNGSMNTASLVEAADTPPLFHNNSAKTIEEAVRFYTRRIFSSDNPFHLDGTQVNQVAAFLRAINALDNAGNASVLAEDAERQPTEQARQTIEVAAADTEDAIEVLTHGPMAPLYADAVADLEEALGLAEDALDAEQRASRNALLRQARELLDGIPGWILRSKQEPEVADGDRDADGPPAAQSEGDDDRASADQTQSDGDGDRASADQTQSDGDGDRAQADQTQSDGDGDRAQADQTQSDGDSDRQEEQRAEGADDDGDRPPEDQTEVAGDGDQPPEEERAGAAAS